MIKDWTWERIRNIGSYFITVIFYTLNFIIASCAIELIKVSLQIKNSKELLDATEKMMQEDVFFGEKAEMIFYVVFVIAIVVLLFLLLVITLYYQTIIMQFNKTTTIMKVLGYSNQMCYWKLCFYNCLDFVPVTILTFVLSPQVWERLKKTEYMNLLVKYPACNGRLSSSNSLILCLGGIVYLCAFALLKERKNKISIVERMRGEC